MAVTIKDVAELAEVSPSTVSRVCNGNPSISRETRERVRKAMEQLHYEPAPSAASAPQQRVRQIAAVLPPAPRMAYGNPFYLEALQGICKLCNQRQYAVTVITGQDEGEALRSLQALHQSVQLEGVILLYAMTDDRIADYLREAGLLYVVVGTAPSDRAVCVDNDNLAAGRDAAAYLCGLGHRRIAYLGCGAAFLYSADRKAGYQLALLQNGITPVPEYCVELDAFLSSDPQVLRDLLERNPTAVVASDDILAALLERTCMQLGLSVPGDVSIISFNNSPFAQFTAVPLTSVDINTFHLGFEAASQLIAHVEDPDLLTARIIIPHHIVERGSCSRIE